MKLQLDGERLRLRISEGELMLLDANGGMEQAWPCPDGSEAHCRIALTPAAEQAHCSGSLMDLQVTLPRDEFLAFAAERPRRDGFSCISATVRLDIEIDVRAPRRVREDA